MSIIKAYRCDYTGKLFDSRTKYIRHLKKLANENIYRKVCNRINNERLEFMKSIGESVITITDLEDFIKDRWDWFFLNGVQRQMNKKIQYPKHELIKTSITEVKFTNTLSNSHSCPIGGVINFGNENGVKSYPGWQGRLILLLNVPKMNEYSSGFGSDYFKDTIINTGSGGGGRRDGIDGDGLTHYAYDVKLFADDFTAMYDKKIKTEAWAILNEKQ